MDAYSVVGELSGIRNNKDRGDYVLSLAEDIARHNGASVVVQKIPVDAKYGNRNVIVDSGQDTVFALAAHYDARMVNRLSGRTIPGANDNASGVGAASEAAMNFGDLPVDILFLGAEEDSCHCAGSVQYLAMPHKKIMGVICVDTCGSGDLGIYVPAGKENAASWPDTYGAVPIHNTCVPCRNLLLYGDHHIFSYYGIPSALLCGLDDGFFGIADGARIDGKGVLHTEGDTIGIIDRAVLETAAGLLVGGTKALFSQPRISPVLEA